MYVVKAILTDERLGLPQPNNASNIPTTLTQALI